MLALDGDSFACLPGLLCPSKYYVSHPRSAPGICYTVPARRYARKPPRINLACKIWRASILITRGPATYSFCIFVKPRLSPRGPAVDLISSWALDCIYLGTQERRLFGLQGVTACYHVFCITKYKFRRCQQQLVTACWSSLLQTAPFRSVRNYLGQRDSPYLLPRRLAAAEFKHPSNR